EHHKQDSAPDQARELPQLAPEADPQPARNHGAPQAPGEPSDHAHHRSHARADLGQGKQQPIHVMPQEREAEGHGEGVHEIGGERAVPGRTSSNTMPKAPATTVVRVSVLRKGSPISGLPSARASSTDRSSRAPFPTTSGDCAVAAPSGPRRGSTETWRAHPVASRP